MQNRIPFLLLACLGLNVALLDAQNVAKGRAAQSSVEQRRGVSPMTKLEKATLTAPVFIENIGQFDPKVKFQVMIGSQAMWLTNEGIVFDATRPAAVENVVAADTRSIDAKNVQGTLSASALKLVKPEAWRIERLVFSEDFVAGSCCSKVEGKNPLPGIYNYFQGSDPKDWSTNIRGYAEVIYRDVWPGVDLRVYSNGPDLEQEFILQPGADLTNVRIAYRGIEKVGISADGSLEINTAFGTLRETKPQLYQQIAGKRVTIDGRFKLTSENSYAFDVGAHLDQYALVIDPTLLYSTFLGGSAGNNASNQEVATGVTVDASGSAYVTGYTVSANFPTTTGAFLSQVPNPGNWSSYVTKLNATGSALVYSTYLSSPPSGALFATAITVDNSGNAYVTGYGANSGFPTTSNAYWPTNSTQHCASNDFFVTELSPTGSQLVYSSCFSATATPNAITLGSPGHVFIAGSTSSSIPTTSNSFQPSYPGGGGAGFLMVIDSTASGSASLVYSSYLGIPTTLGNRSASASGIAVDSFGKIYATGSTSDGFPVTPGAFQTTHSGCVPNGPFCPATTDAFVAKLDPSASGAQSLIYATYLGGLPVFGSPVGSAGSAITVDASGNAYVTGTTASSNFPVTPGAFQTTCPGYPGYVFVSKLNAGGSHLVYSTCLAGNLFANSNSAGGIAVDSLGNAYIAGGFRAQSLSTFPVTSDAFQSSFSKPGGDSHEAFLTKVNPSGSGLVYSSYFGGVGDDVATGIALDPKGDAYIAGYTSSPNLPIRLAFQPNMIGTGDAFVAKFSFSLDSGPLIVKSAFPDHGGNTGTVSAIIIGNGFQVGASTKLGCLTDIIGVNNAVSSDGTTISAQFDLTGQIPSACSVIVTNPDGTMSAQAAAFKIDLGGEADIQLEVWGRSAIRGGVASVFLAGVTNRGSIDSGPVRIWISFPDFLEWTPSAERKESSAGQIDAARYVAFDVVSVSAGSTAWIPFQLIPPSTPDFAHRPFTIKLWRERP